MACEECKSIQTSAGEAEARAAIAEADLGRERLWWLGWLGVSVLLLAYVLYLTSAFSLKSWFWYDFVLPARQSRQAPAQSIVPAQQQRLRQPAQVAPQRRQGSQARPPATTPPTRRRAN